MEPKDINEIAGKFAGFMRRYSPAVHYSIALVLCVAATIADVLVPGFGHHFPFIPFFLATAISSWLGGFRTGLFSTAAALIIVEVYFLPPRGSTLTPLDLLRLLFGMFVMLAISWLVEQNTRKQHRMEAALRHTEDKQRRFEARLASAVKIAGMGSWEYDIVNDRLDWDEETLRIFGITKDAFGGDSASFFNLVHPDDREDLQRIQTQSTEAHGITELQYRIVRPDGTIRRIHDRGQVTQHLDGKAVRSTGMVMDITERKQAEEALRASEERWRAIFDNSGVGVALVDASGYLIMTNRTYQKMVGYTAQELATMTFLDLTVEEDRSANRVLSDQLWRGEMPQYQFEKRYRRKEGKIIWVRTTVSLAPGSQITPRFAMAVVEDITTKRALEERVHQSQRMEAVGRLAGGVAHDFNNMLGVILGHTLKLQETLKIGTPEWQNVQQIKKASSRSADLTHQLLAFSRKQILSPKVLDLNAVISDLRSMLNSMVGDDIDLIFTPGQNLKHITADQGQIGQAVMNLVANARDAMPNGGKITVTTDNVLFDPQPLTRNLETGAGRFVRLCVSDTGCGIEPENLSHIFEPFYTTKALGDGTGLGLATVYGIVKQSDGYITAESQPGSGSTFSIYLPQVKNGHVREQSVVEEASSGGGHETILLAEDEPMLCEIVRFQLESAGYTVLEAHDGKQALALAHSHTGRIDLLLTDVLMAGGMNGVALADEITPTRPDLKVLFMTGYTADIIDVKGLADLKHKLLQKPFTALALRRKVREILSAK